MIGVGRREEGCGSGNILELRSYGCAMGRGRVEETFLKRLPSMYILSDAEMQRCVMCFRP